MCDKYFPNKWWCDESDRQTNDSEQGTTATNNNRMHRNWEIDSKSDQNKEALDVLVIEFI